MTAEKTLELRMYFFVPYNISPIQQAIQAGHAALEYAHLNGGTPLFKDFVKNWKTWIVLNGGTTNNKMSDVVENEFAGTLNQLKSDIIRFNFQYRNDDDFVPIEYADFYEPDLNDALTAVCFICDERVFNYKDYPDFVDWILNVKMYPEARDATPAENIVLLKMQSDEALQEQFPEYYIEWVTFMGGEKNIFLRDLIRGKKLA